jgi:hypothetical protein
MKSNVSGDSHERIRMTVFLPVALLLALGVVALILARSRPQASAQRLVKKHAEEPASGVTSSFPRGGQVGRDSESLRSSQSEAEPETARLIALMLDKSLSLQLRRKAARSLAKIGTDEALTALKTALAGDNPPYLKAAIAEGLGGSPNPQARDLLQTLLNGKDETTARAAARGLALRGDTDAVDTLGTALFNDQTPLSVRTEAALALGDVDLPGAQDLLVRAIAQIQDEDVREGVLDGLGRRPFSETKSFFQDYLNSPGVPPGSKVLAIEAITDAEGDVRGFLSNYINDPNHEVSAAAKSALDFINPSPTPASTDVVN